MGRKYNGQVPSSTEKNLEETTEGQSQDQEPQVMAMLEREKSKRKRKLKESLLEQHKEKLSRQKKKRLDKYIEHQMKREEKEILLQKLSETRIDSSVLKSAKLIGTGTHQTKRERFLEALEQEIQGKGDKETQDILYEQRTIKNWDDEEEQVAHKDCQAEVKTNISVPMNLTSGFGFTSHKKEPKNKKTKKYSWRVKLELERSKKKAVEDRLDFASDEDEGEEEEEQEEEVASNDVDEAGEKKLKKREEEEGEEEGEESEDAFDDGEDEGEDETNRGHSKRAQSFKEWAETQVKNLEVVPDFVTPSEPQKSYTPIIRQEDLDDGLGEDFIPINEGLQRKIVTIDVQRDDSIQKARMQLPVFEEEHRIMEAIHHNDCVIICGETGSGKTTQVPQFLFESGYGSPDSDTPGMIGITQPRRVAAVAMAERVGQELGNYKNRVGHQIRFDASVGEETSVKFMTDGVLLREMMSDFLLTKYSALIIDEAHERNINTDILIGMLSRVLKLRRDWSCKDPAKYKPLKLIIMSATLRVSEFSENKNLFGSPPPIINVQTRQYPVSIHFNRRTAFNYNEEAFRKTCKIHSKLPRGGILIFLTGKGEINEMVRRLRKRYPLKKGKSYDDVAEVKVDSRYVDIEAEEVDFSVNEMVHDLSEEYSNEEDDEEEEGFDETLEEGQTAEDPLYVLPLYSLLPTKEQMKIFERPPNGARLCVVATNIAETSLTIPNIRYVVDCGRSKERSFNEDTGVQSYEIKWISKASADQRAGRAGRTGPGHCYRLFSSAVYESEFTQFSKPEILRMPAESVVLTMKSMGIDNIINFPFVTPPTRDLLRKAEKLLQHLGALDDRMIITKLGQKMSRFPLSPRFAKMLLVANQQGCLPYIIALVSGLSVGDPFVSEWEIISGGEDEENEWKNQQLSKFNNSRQLFTKLDKFSDGLQLLSAICAQDHIPRADREKFFESNFLRPKIMDEIVKLRKQLTYIVKVNLSKESIAVSPLVKEEELKLSLPTKVQVEAIKQMITAGFIDHVAVRADIVDKNVKIPNNAPITAIRYLTLMPTSDTDSDGFVYIHPNSVLSKCGEMPPSYLVYQSLTANSASTTKTLRMKPLTNIGGRALANVAAKSGLITYSKPLGHPYAPKEISQTERECYVVPRMGANIGTGGVGWDLPAMKVRQSKIRGNWVIK
ncbi:hypothetical protein KL948_005331 [Ogataea haglerorum]|nr:hypothetical protein KL948_005331 [Ogataea haglerorum]